MRRLSVLIICLLLLVGCTTTEYITPQLPTFEPIRPERPQLISIDEQIPPEVNINTIRLVSYIKQLEAYADGWEEYYDGLQDL